MYLFGKCQTKLGQKVVRIVVAFSLSLVGSSVVFAQQIFAPQTTQNPAGYAQPYSDNSNYSTDTPFKTEVARLEAFVYRPGKETLPLMQVPRLQQGDVLKIKVPNEPVNGIMPDQSNWDWTLMVAFINPSRNQDKEKTLSEEIRLRESGWYKDYFFTVPYDCQPIIFLYPKSKYRKKILNFIEKRPDDIRQMGEKVIEISNAYAQVSSFLFQLQDLMMRQGSSNLYYSQFNGQSNNLIAEQSIEGLARSFNLQLPSCWRNDYSYGANLQSRAQCISKNIRLDDLNFSVGKMLQQGALMAVAQLTKSHPELSKWIAIAAMAIDFIMKLTRKTAIHIIPAIVSSTENPLYMQSNYQGGFYNANGVPNGANGFQNNNQPSRISLYANTQPTDREFVSVYAFVPHKWQANADPEVFHLYPPKPDEACLHSGKNILRNNDLRLEWLTDTFTRNFRLVLSDKSGWTKEFELKKNLGLNAWEAEISKEDLNLIPKTSAPFDAKIVGTRGFNEIQSPSFSISIANGGGFEAQLKTSDTGKTKVVLRSVAGNSVCSQNVIYKSKAGQQMLFPLTDDNNFVNFAADKREISFEIDSAISEPEFIQVQQYGGETISVPVKP